MYPLLTLDDLKAALPSGASLPEPDMWLAKEKASLADYGHLPQVWQRWRQMLAYDPATGHLWSRFMFFYDRNKALMTKPPKRRRRTGNYIEDQGTIFSADKMVWYLHHGVWLDGPKALIHLNDSQLDDRIENLAEAVSRRCPNVRRKMYLWEAFFLQDGKSRRIGIFETEDRAIEAYETWKAGGYEPVKRGKSLGVARRYDKWQAYAPLPLGRQKHLGVYATREEALAARRRWDEGTMSGALQKELESGIADLI